jgi:mono/diheme cytochrome c family protein
MKGNLMRFCPVLASALFAANIATTFAFAASSEHGKAVFIQNGCWQCHGTMGQGSIATSGGKRLAPDPLPWDTFSAFVRSTNRSMPPFSETILSDGDLADIYAYLQSIPKPPAVNSIPLLNQQ